MVVTRQQIQTKLSQFRTITSQADQAARDRDNAISRSQRVQLSRRSQSILSQRRRVKGELNDLRNAFAQQRGRVRASQRAIDKRAVKAGQAEAQRLSKSIGIRTVDGTVIRKASSPVKKKKRKVLGAKQTLKKEIGGKVSITAAKPKLFTSLAESQAAVQKQRLDNFLQASTKKELTQRDVNSINDAIDAQVKRSKDKKLNFAIARGNLSKEVSLFITSLGSKGLSTLNPVNLAKFSFNTGRELGRIVFSVTKSLALGLKATFNYGRNLVKRGLWSRKKNPFIADIGKLSKGTLSVTRYVVRNPAETGMIIGIAFASGLGIAAKTIRTKPEKALAEAVFFLAPVGAASKISKAGKSALQVKNVAILNLKVAFVKKSGNLSAKQINSLNGAIVRASKLTEAKKRTETVKRSLKGILKDRGIKPKRKAGIKTLSKQIIESSKKEVKLISKSARKPVIKQEFFVISKSGKVSKRKVSSTKFDELFPEKVKRTRDKTQFAKIVDGKPIKITKKEFLALQKPIKKKRLVLDVTKQAEASLKRRLKKQGVVKQGGETFIDVNAVRRLEKAKTPVKIGFGNKKGQVQIQIQINKAVNKIATQVKKVKKSRKKPSKKIKKGINKKISALIKLIRAFQASRILTKAEAASFLKKLSDIKADISKPAVKPAVAVATAQKPSFKPASAQAVSTAFKPKRPQISKSKAPKRPKAPKKPRPPVKPKVLRLPLRTKRLLKKGSRQGYIIRIKEGNRIVRISTINLPRNRATNIMRSFLDNNIQASGEIVPRGRTPIVDVKKTILSNKFRVKRGKNRLVRRNVEKRKFRLDKAGEKKISKKR